MEAVNLLYVAQFHETCGYSHAAIGYLKSLDQYIKETGVNINLKVLSMSLDLKKFSDDYHLANNRTEKEVLDLVKSYHFKDQEEIDNFLGGQYRSLWHMTSVLPIIIKDHNINFFYKQLDVNIEKIILGSEENYHILAWETDKLCQEYESVIKNYKPSTVIVPSKWNENTISKFWNSVTIPHLIEKKSELSKKVNLPVDLSSKFVALSISEWTNRKNFKTLIRSFILEFHDKDDAVLIIKSSLPAGQDKSSFLSQFKDIKQSIRTNSEKKQNIFVILDYLSSEKISYLYQNCNIFCLSSYGEGFSLPTSEAVSYGKPVLCPKVGGHVDYIDSENPFFVDGIWETVFDDPPYDTDGRWFVTSVDDTRKKLKLAYEDWRQGSQILNESANKNTDILKSGRFSKTLIGKSLVNTVSTPSLPKTKIENLKIEVQNKDLKQQMDILSDKYSGDECYILNCGPSLLDYDQKKLNDFLKNKLVFTVKQAYLRHGCVSDFHFFNCSNLPKPKDHLGPYYENSKSSIFIASSNYNQYMRWSKVQTSDVFFKVPIRTEIENEFLVKTGKIDEFLIKNNLTRPCGPGIMYETVLFMAQHIGVKKIICIGWDLTDKDNVDVQNYNHFYGSTEGLLNRGDILPWEIEETRKFSETFYKWCENNNIELELASTRSALSDKIPRIKLEL